MIFQALYFWKQPTLIPLAQMDQMNQNQSLLSHRALGAQVLQASLGDSVAVFYLSPLSAVDAPARGGVPLLFPQFADRGPLSKHGFVRQVPWRLLADAMQAGAQQLHYALDLDAQPSWPHSARLDLRVQASNECLVLTLTVHNTGPNAFSWTGGLHPYFAVTDVLTAKLSGVAGLDVQDRYDTTLTHQPAGELTWSAKPFERLYSACPALLLDAGGHHLRLSATGFDQWMVWNPGESGALALADLPAPDWRRFVCVEPVCVARPIVLAPGASFAGGMRIELVKP